MTVNKRVIFLYSVIWVCNPAYSVQRVTAVSNIPAVREFHASFNACPSMATMETTIGHGAPKVTPENIAEVFARLSTQTRREVYAKSPDALVMEPENARPNISTDFMHF
mgnify:CR=1 FL=1